MCQNQSLRPTLCLLGDVKKKKIGAYETWKVIG